jgi:hypothetical protein
MSDTTNINSAKSYSDFSALGELRGKAQRDDAGAARESAEQIRGLIHSNDAQVHARSV